MRFLRFTQLSSGLDVVIPRPKKIKNPLQTKSKLHHLATGRPSTGNNTSLFIKYTLSYKDGVDKDHLPQFIALYLTGNRSFRFYLDSTIEEFENVFIIGNFSFQYLSSKVLHATNIKMELFSNGPG